MGKGPGFCPHCQTDLAGEPIPEEHLQYYGGWTHYERQIGVEVRGEYDGVLFWRCPDCDKAWHRFGDEYMQFKAQPYINQINEKAGA